MDYLKRLCEEAVVVFLAGGATALVLDGEGLTKAALLGAAMAGLRAVYGLGAKKFGAADRPSVQ